MTKILQVGRWVKKKGGQYPPRGEQTFIVENIPSSQSMHKLVKNGCGVIIAKLVNVAHDVILLCRIGKIVFFHGLCTCAWNLYRLLFGKCCHKVCLSSPKKRGFLGITSCSHVIFHFFTFPQSSLMDASPLKFSKDYTKFMTMHLCDQALNCLQKEQ